MAPRLNDLPWILMAIGLAIFAPTRLSAQCVGTQSLDFNDNTLGPFLVPYLSCGAVAASGGQLILSKPACAGEPAASMSGTGYKLCGDFDISVDFSLTDFTVPSSGSRWTGLYLFTEAGSHYAVAERYNRFAIGDCAPATSNYKFYTTSPLNCHGTLIPTGDPSGRLRVRRTGTTLSFYYWTGTWTQALTTTAVNVPVVLALSTASDGASSQESRFDNLTITSESIPQFVCIGNYADDFEDGVASPVLQSGGCGSVSEAGGKTVLSRSTSCGQFAGPFLTTSPERVILGNFDIQVDYAVAGFTLPPNGSRYAGLQVYGASGEGNQIIVERFQHNPRIGCMPTNDVYTSWDSDPNICVNPIVATSDVAGRFRISRTGSAYTAYFWSGSGWTLLDTGPIIAGPVKFSLFTAGEAGLAQQASFDNLVIVSSCPDVVGPQVRAPDDAIYQCASDVPDAGPEQAVVVDAGGVASVAVAETSNGGAGSPSEPLLLTRTWTALDTSGNPGSGTQVITVIDDTSPALTVPADVVATTGPGTEACSDVRAQLEVGSASATDNCSEPSVSTSGLPEGGLFPVGETLLFWTATDASGNVAADTQRVVVSCPVGDLAGSASLLCNGQDSPASDVTVRLLHEGSPFRTVTTGVAGDYLFEDVRHGTYTVAVEAPAGYATAPDTRLVTIDQAGVTTAPFVFTCLLSDMTGQVTGTCNGQTEPLQGITVDVYREDGGGMDVLVASTGTDAGGNYRFDDLALGDYTVGVITPLGYSAATASQAVSLATPDGTASVPAFSLECQAITAQPRTMGYWKHQVNVYLTGKGNAQETLADLLRYIDELVVHFNQNLVNPVIVYVPNSANTQDKLLQLQQLLTVNKGGATLDRAKQHLLALLLNVVSGKISQTEVISDDGATVSQAITYSHDLIVDGSPGNDDTARAICDLVNNGQRVPVGLVPTGTRQITYAAQLEQGGSSVAFGIERVHPNPAAGEATVSLGLTMAGAATLDVFNVAGRRVWHQTLAAGSGRLSVPIPEASRFAAGVYMVVLRQGSVKAIKRMVIAR